MNTMIEKIPLYIIRGRCEDGTVYFSMENGVMSWNSDKSDATKYLEEALAIAMKDMVKAYSKDHQWVYQLTVVEIDHSDDGVPNENEPHIWLAKMIQEAAAEHEHSFNMDKGEYALSIQEAAYKVCAALAGDESLAFPVCLLLNYHWNDALRWAEEQDAT